MDIYFLLFVFGNKTILFQSLSLEREFKLLLEHIWKAFTQKWYNKKPNYIFIAFKEEVRTKEISLFTPILLDYIKIFHEVTFYNFNEFMNHGVLLHFLKKSTDTWTRILNGKFFLPCTFDDTMQIIAGIINESKISFTESPRQNRLYL